LSFIYDNSFFFTSVYLTKSCGIVARRAFLSLFENKKTYYYGVLLTTGEAHAPYISAWSKEALERVREKRTHDESIKRLKYSPSDSPYCLFGYNEFFTSVVEMFESRSVDSGCDDDDEWDKEVNIRYHAMNAAMKRLDDEGLFSQSQPRENILFMSNFWMKIRMSTQKVQENSRTARMLFVNISIGLKHSN
jgi:hypothetical protein